MTLVAVVTGPVGVGKSEVLKEADRLLVEAGVKHATVELEDVARCWPTPNATRDVAYRNLASLWVNFSAAGADRLLLGLLMEQRSELAPVHQGIPGAEITVVRLEAPLSLIEERLRRREKSDPEAEICAAHWWVSRLDGSQVGDLVVDNCERPPREVAAEMLQALGWLPK